MTVHPRVLELARDLRFEAPRSPHETLGGFVIAARMLDKCRAQLADCLGEYQFNCPLDNFFFTFAEVKAEDFANFVASGVTDRAVDGWIREHTSRTENAIKIWNIQLRHMRIPDLPPQVQLYLEDYIQQHVPRHRRVYTWFDVYDLEEGVI